jgi:hypothetical protein
VDRSKYEALVRDCAWRPEGADLVGHLTEQVVLYETPSDRDLEPLAAILAERLSGAEVDPTRLSADSGQPLVHFYRGALAYEQGDDELALAALGEALKLDPGEPIAHHLHAHLSGESPASVSSAERLQVLDRMAKALMADPYERAVDFIAATIRAQRRPRVLEVGVGGGTQIVALLERLAADPGEVEELRIVGLDIVPEYLEGVAGRLDELDRADLPPFSFEAVEGSVETIDAATRRRIAGDGIDAINASIVLHEVPGLGKLDALRALAEFEGAALAMAEWNFTTENVIGTREALFLFNVRGAAAAMAGAVRPGHGLEVARKGVRVWLGQGHDQLVGDATVRQECFLSADGWERLFAATGWDAKRTSGTDGRAAIVTWDARPTAA